MHQIHTFVKFRLGSSQPSPHASNCVSEPSFPDVHLSSPVAIGLPIFSLWYLAITLAIQWRSWRLITKGEGWLRPTGFSTSPLTMIFKSGKPHALISGQFADRLNNLSCVRINKWEYIFRVTYIFRWQRRLFT